MARVLYGSTIVICLMTAMTHAGGWAVVTLTTPDAAIVGKPVTVRYAVRQHGQQLLGGLAGRVEARLNGMVISAPATPLDQDGYYAATLTLPVAGAWTLDVVSGFLASSGRGALRAVHAGETAPALSPVEKGRHLFVAKGCATCHEGMASVPAIKKAGYDPQFLTRFLKSPPVRGENVWSMPNLGLGESEIAALVAYLNVSRAEKAGDAASTAP